MNHIITLTLKETNIEVQQKYIYIAQNTVSFSF